MHFSSVCLLSTFKSKSLECRTFLCCPNAPSLFNHGTVSRGTLLKVIPAAPALGKESVLLDMESFWELGLSGCTGVCLASESGIECRLWMLWNEALSLTLVWAGTVGLSDYSSSLMLWCWVKNLFYPPQGLVRSVNWKRLPSSLSSLPGCDRRGRMCFGVILHPVRKRPCLCLQPHLYISATAWHSLCQLGFQPWERAEPVRTVWI